MGRCCIVIKAEMTYYVTKSTFSANRTESEDMWKDSVYSPALQYCVKTSRLSLSIRHQVPCFG